MITTDNSPVISGTLKQLFQQEFSKMVAVISKLYGLQHIETAEDIVSETFLQATETWDKKGIPQNPTAWLYTVAKRKTLQLFRRNKIYERKVIPALVSLEEINDHSPELDFSQENIRDSQLQMLFAICTPAIASEAQIGLALRILCGFGIDEIAEAFLSNKETINKRLFRAKEKLRAEKIQLVAIDSGLSEHEITSRLDNVLLIVYLLFSEGYYSKTQNEILRKDLCLEAMRLGLLLTGHETTNRPKTNALMALMCFHASRFSARETNDNDLVLYDQQDESLWDAELINQGMHFLQRSAAGQEISSYHLEARIAFWHCIKSDSLEKWTEVLELYDQLLLINYSPSVALNRTYALYKASADRPGLEGRKAALAEAEKLRLDNNHFYYVLLGELYQHIDNEKSLLNFKKAREMARTERERDALSKKMLG